MSAPLRQPIKILFALAISAAPLPAFCQIARDHDGGAIAAGIAGGVAGTMASQALSGALPPPGYYPPPKDCVWEQEMVQKPYSMHIGQVRVCQ